MKIKLIPQYRDDELTVSRFGDVLTINGVEYDFGPLPAGATLPAHAIDCPYFSEQVDRDENGVLHIALLLPIQRSIFMDVLPDIINPPDGPIELPMIVETDVMQVSAIVGTLSTVYGAPESAISNPQYLAPTVE